MNRASVSVVATDSIDLDLVEYKRKMSHTAEIAGAGLRRRSSVLKEIISIRGLTGHEIAGEAEEFEEGEVEYAPDGGAIAWTVAIASLLNNFCLDGISFAYGVLTEKVTNEEFTDLHYHLCGSVMLGTTLLIGPLVSLMSNRWGFRAVSMIGSVIASAGFLLSWAGSPESPSFLYFLLGFGILGGIGFGMMFTSSIVVLGKFFVTNLPLATGIATTGSAIGQIVMPLVLGTISETYGWQHSFLFMSGFCLCSVVFGAMYFTPPKRVQKIRKVKESQSDMSDLWELVRSPTFWILSVSGGIVVLGYFVPPAFIQDKARGKPFNATFAEANLLPSLIGGSNAIGRIAFGILANSDRAVYSLVLTNAAVTFGGVATIVSVYATEYWMLALYTIIFGQMIAIYASLRSVIVYQLVGKDKFNLAFGVSLLFMGVSLYFGNTFAGWLRESTGGFDATFHYTGAFFLLSAILCYPLPWIHKYEMSKRPRRFSIATPNGIRLS